jgi:L-lactate dehydrogenase (cytochrome)
MRLSDCRNISDLRRLAERRLPAPIFHFADGGSDDELSLRENCAAFERWRLVPEYLVDVDHIDTRCRVLGKEASIPLLLSPTGMSSLFHRDKEAAVAAAAAKAGVSYVLSMMSSTTIEKLAGLQNASNVFQIKVLKDRGLAKEFLSRCRASGYAALCILVDAPVGGNKERDLEYGMTMPPKISVKSVLRFAARPLWTASYFLGPDFSLANFEHIPEAKRDGLSGLVKYAAEQTDRRATWEDAAWLAQEWGGPTTLKGLQSASDAKRAVQYGFDSIMISNHGGRQLDGGRPPMDCIREIRSAVGGDIELIIDGGVRRGAHVVKAIAAGANACSIGRPYIYGLAAGGQAGVEKCLSILNKEIERCMALIGCKQISDISERHVHRIAGDRYQEFFLV